MIIKKYMKRLLTLPLVAMLIFPLLIAGCAKKDDINVIDDNYRNYYEIFVYSFYDSDNDGIGDIKGVDEKLGYIKDMGFNGIWLMPVMESTTYHKYDVVDYLSIDSEYGTMEDMKQLVKDAHEKNINIIIDFVMNHTSSKHEWFIKACDYLKKNAANDKALNELIDECKEVGYYHFTKDNKGGAYYQVPGTDYYYEAQFWEEMPDLNYDSKELRAEFENIAQYWVSEIGVDGFRMDATLHFEEGNTEYNTEVMNWIYEYCKAINPDFYMVSEVWASESTIASYYQSKTDSLFNFDAADAEGKLIKCARGTGNVASLVKAMKGYEEDFSAVYPDYIDAVFITNHDMGRVSSALLGDQEAIKYAGGLMMSMNGSTFVYYGEELGMKSKGNKDENKRLPMLWSREDTKGMTAGPIDSDKDIEQTCLYVDEALEDDNSILNYYKHAIKIRNRFPEIARGIITIDEQNTDGKHALIKKTYGENEIVVIYNNSPVEEWKLDITGTVAEGYKIADYLTVDNSDIILNNNIITIKPRSIVYLK